MSPPAPARGDAKVGFRVSPPQSCQSALGPEAALRQCASFTVIQQSTIGPQNQTFASTGVGPPEMCLGMVRRSGEFGGDCFARQALAAVEDRVEARPAPVPGIPARAADRWCCAGASRSANDLAHHSGAGRWRPRLGQCPHERTDCKAKTTKRTKLTATGGVSAASAIGPAGAAGGAVGASERIGAAASQPGPF